MLLFQFVEREQGSIKGKARVRLSAAKAFMAEPSSHSLLVVVVRTD